MNRLHCLRSFFVGAVAGWFGIGVHSLVADEGIAYFERTIRPLLVEHCLECHTGLETKGGLRLDSRDGWLLGGDSGPAIVPGTPQASRLIEAIKYSNRDLQMPPKARLSSQAIEAFERWIAMGAPDPRRETPTDSMRSPIGMNLEEGRNFWSLLPLGDPTIPLVRQTEWVLNPLDAFILAKLEENGLAPQPAADKGTLLRRVTLDLTGVPPTAMELEAFLNDKADDAYERVVERLLHSPRYGVRWGRHWLDVARYADSNGLDENLAMGTAWRYRDYVIDSFNQDKPYHQFVMEQIAGDLLPEASLTTRTATGFLVLGAKVLAEKDEEKLIMDTIDEQLDTLGKAFWGMTLGCVRCHDHKFDPLTQTDYYGLAAILKSTQTLDTTKNGAIHHWNEHVFASSEEQAFIQQIDKDIAAKNKLVADFKRQALNRIRAQARTHAAKYLAAAAALPSDCSLEQAEDIGRSQALNPRVLYHTCRFVALHQDEPFFAVWKEQAARKDYKQIEVAYQQLFDQVEAAVAQLKTQSAKFTKLDSPELEEARSYLYDGTGFLAIPSKPDFAFDPITLAEYKRLSEDAIAFESQAPDMPTAMAVRDGRIHTKIPIHIRGSHRNLGAEVPRGFPAVMSSPNTGPVFPPTESGRLELAQWMAHANHPLSARVYANRLWQWHFGSGIVRTPDNFGATGERPSHPELLDWLSRRLIESKWSTKSIHRLIVLSNTYRTRSSTLPVAKDPENRWLSKFPLQRLDVEQLRDSLLFLAGRLDEAMGGKTIALRNRQFVFNHTSTDRSHYETHRRSTYIPVVRNHLYGLFEQFDFPDPTMPTGSRHQTTIPAQSLAMMNSELVMDCSDAFAGKLIAATSDRKERVRLAISTVYNRPAAPSDLRLAEEFFVALMPPAVAGIEAKSSTDFQAWSLYCQSLFASNEFFFVR